MTAARSRRPNTDSSAITGVSTAAVTVGETADVVALDGLLDELDVEAGVLHRADDRDRLVGGPALVGVDADPGLRRGLADGADASDIRARHRCRP